MKATTFLASSLLLALTAAAPIDNSGKREAKSFQPNDFSYTVGIEGDGLAAEAEKRDSTAYLPGDSPYVPHTDLVIDATQKRGDSALPTVKFYGPVPETEKRQTYNPKNGFYVVSADADGVEAQPEKRQGHNPKFGGYVVGPSEDGVAAEAEKRQTYNPKNGFYVVSAGTDGVEAQSEKRQGYNPKFGGYVVGPSEDGIAAEAEKRQTYNPKNGFYVVSAGTDGVEAQPEKRQG